jgi:predicted O-linked N-acetylglucosamine transferase (SPINDLY family)
VPTAQLILLVPAGSARTRTLDVLEQEGIRPERVEFVPRQARSQYLETYQRIDIGLDTFPYNGQTTTLDCAWLGVPVITIRGQTAAGRAGMSLLKNLGLPEFIADTPEQFVRIAVDLAGDLPRLASLRSGLRAFARVSPDGCCCVRARNRAGLPRHVAKVVRNAFGLASESTIRG